MKIRHPRYTPHAIRDRHQRRAYQKKLRDTGSKQFWRVELRRRGWDEQKIDDALHLFEEFQALSNVVPRNLGQASWICRTIEHFVEAHPELRFDIERYYSTLFTLVVDGKIERGELP